MQLITHRSSEPVSTCAVSALPPLGGIMTLLGGVRFITSMGPHCHPSISTYLFFLDISALRSAQAPVFFVKIKMYDTVNQD